MPRPGTLRYAAALLCAGTVAAAQSRELCAPHQRALADFGYDGIECINCEINSSAPVWIIFHAPARLRDIRAGGPAFGKLAEGDTLVAIDGIDIASSKGSGRYSSATPGESVEFTVRRNGSALTIPILTGTKCAPGVSPPSGVRAGVMYRELVRSAIAAGPSDSRRGWIGVAIESGIRPESIATLAASSQPFSTFLLVRLVAPGGPAALAGIEPGDRLIAVDGASLLTTEGATRFRNPVPGVAMSVSYIRHGEEYTTTIVPSVAPPEPPMIRRRP